MPGFDGNESDTETLLARPSPLFVTVIVNPIWLPAFTGVASATLVIARSGQLTVIEAEAELFPVFASLLADAVAVLLIGDPQVFAVVGETI